MSILIAQLFLNIIIPARLCVRVLNTKVRHVERVLTLFRLATNWLLLIDLGTFDFPQKSLLQSLNWVLSVRGKMDTNTKECGSRLKSGMGKKIAEMLCDGEQVSEEKVLNGKRGYYDT